MSHLYLDDSTILDEASSPETYRRGILYAKSNRVRKLEFDQDKLCIHGIVQGTHPYKVDVFFTDGGEVDEYECTCPSHYKYSAACKHIVAVLKKSQEVLSHKDFEEKRNKNKVSQMFSFFDSLGEDRVKKEVELEVIYILKKDYGNTYYSALELKLGEDRLYIVRKTGEFIEKLYNKESYELGKKFTFDPFVHKFSTHAQKIIDLLLEIYKNEVDLFGMERSYYEGVERIFHGKEIILTTPYLVRVFDILKERPFKANIFEKGIHETVIMEDMKWEFELGKSNEDMIFSITSDNFIPITEEGLFFYKEGRIYKASSRQKKYYSNFLDKMFFGKNKSVKLSNTEASRFVSEVLPYIQKVGEVRIDKSIEERLSKEELQTKIYFDKFREGISAVVEFHYGEMIIKPFGISSYGKSGDKILIRDVENEKVVISIFEACEFSVDREKIYLEDESSIYEFISEYLPKLQEISEIYYSEDFKNINIKYPSGFGGRVRLNQELDILEVSFTYEDIDRDELKYILGSIREKKKYYRLKDGSFIPLNSPELLNMAKLAEGLGISESIAEQIIRIPKYRAMYIDSLIRESEVQNIERNQSFKHMVQNIREPQDMEFEIPHTLKEILRDYQKTGFKWLNTLSAYGLGGILADDMGLGKTLQVISIVLAQKDNKKPSLVVAPTSLVYNWQDEVKKFAPSLNVLIVSGILKERQQQLEEIGNADLVVTSYPLIRRDIDLYKDLTFFYCFLDEAQHIKNPATLNAKSVKKINAKGKFALTGTPIENSITELWSIFDFIMPGYLLSHTKFVKKFESPIIKDGDKGVLEDLKRYISPFILRRMKKDVLKELPDKIESKMTCNMEEEQKKIYLAYLEKAKGEISIEIKNNGFEKSHIKILSLLTRLRQICCHPSLFIEDYKGESGKMQLLEEILGDAFDSGHRILLFSQFTSMLEIIKKHVEDKGIEYFYLDGSTPSVERVGMVKAFNRGVGKLFLISLKAGGTGLNLTGADMVIHYDPWWNPAVEEQASDRAHRIGQTNVVQVMKLITKGTIEEKIYMLQQKKKEMIDTIINPGETLLSKMSKEEILELFEI